VAPPGTVRVETCPSDSGQLLKPIAFAEGVGTRVKATNTIVQ
jgi:hypothetical protein